MRRVKLFTIDALPYRQPIPVYGYRFGSRKKTLAVMGAHSGVRVSLWLTEKNTGCDGRNPGRRSAADVRGRASGP